MIVYNLGMAERNTEEQRNLDEARRQSWTFLRIVNSDQQAASALTWQDYLDQRTFADNAKLKREQGVRPEEPGKILPFPGVELPEGEDIV